MKTTHTYRIGFFLIPDFSMLSFSAVIEPLRMANRLAGCDLYQWDIYGFEDKEVSASNGVSFSPTQYRPVMAWHSRQHSQSTTLLI
ncbi:hypothetical protein K6U55_15845 [Vibrio diabolicus]|uniref:hypothetical protein n=1 Tax=Vibrio diabolicus TaxID=50719 RepID=UPI00211B70F4|nr:hypothetical protein [Vibrio diabolicus]MCG6243497.1 hypothetical protein [Vibrio diabolicus]